MMGSEQKEKHVSKKSRRVFKNCKEVALAPAKDLETALHILNTNEVSRKVVRNMCQNPNRRVTDVVHLSNLHYCSLIKQAIMRHNWKSVLKLLLAYIDEPRSERCTNGVIFKYTLIHLLNDSVARSLNIMNEFLQLALSCQTESQKSEFMKIITSISIS